LADERFGRTLGARFGIQKQQFGGNNNYAASATATQAQQLATGNATVGSTVPDLNVNLPVAGSFGSFAFSLFRLPAGFLLNLELSALETDQRGKVVSSPRVTTANQQKAIIEQGTQIPYLEASSSGAATISFKEATLS